MRPIPTKVQKIIMFVPGLNLLCIAIFLYNSFCAKFTLKDYIQSAAVILFPAILLVLICEIAMYYFPAIDIIIRSICSYCVLLIVGFRLLQYQENCLFCNRTEDVSQS